MEKKQGLYPKDSKRSSSPYTPVIVVGDQVHVSGQGPLDPSTGNIKGSTLEDQVELTLQNVRRALETAGCTMADVVKVTAYLSDIGHFDRYNAVYRQHFSEPRPARTTVQCVLWGGILVEIDAIAIRGCGA